jgi:hypothetical protein
MRKLCTAGVVLLLISAGIPAKAQLFVVDDPGTSEAKKFYLLSMVMSSGNRTVGDSQQFLNSQLGYGINDKLEISLLLTALNSVRAAGTPRVSGIGDSGAWIKWRFQDETDRIPSIAVVYQPKFPSASKGLGLGSGSLDHNLWVDAAKTFGRFYTTISGGVTIPGTFALQRSALYGFGVQYQSTSKLFFQGEVYGYERPGPGMSQEFAWNIGMSYNFLPDRSLMLAVGKSQMGYSDLNIFAGLNMVFK